MPNVNISLSPLTWEGADSFMMFFPHGIRPIRCLWGAEKQHLTGWCEEYLGRQAATGCRYHTAWMYYAIENSYHFKSEADLMMFVLAQTGLCMTW